MSFQVDGEVASCGGRLLKLNHESKETKTQMSVNIYLPQQYYTKQTSKIPVIYYLSGLTCSPQNASEKAFWQPQADKYGFAVVFPDTSPRGDEVPDDPENGWDFGLSAGFYVDATQDPYKKNYRMFSYVHDELPRALHQHFQKQGSSSQLDFLDNIAITGHSMGGFGAISAFLQLRSANKYKSCSAFAPMVSPSGVQWGEKAFGGYLGNDITTWKKYDPAALIQTVKNTNNDYILIHQGTSDPFYKKQLKPELLQQAAKGTTWEGKIDVQLVDGFDHSYYFISTFVPKHAEFHAKNLGLI
ncbi:LANO_0H01750g1_1 [Lachancea nothofagi CBS 11611]|uniref:S-formylglutathione hydrolase n=1 Tax=Lachancea nothofagi CBS 11611 TaxID=1266666 RepID=A0A1G4KKV7_9SACH|nr:LANO_0H01750g1_1 [Lachancea nothofagi CBS 11611]